VVFQQRFQELLAELAEEECVGAGAEFQECLVCGCEKRAAFAWGGGKSIEQAGLAEAERKSAEDGGETGDDGESGRGWEENVIYAVDEAIGCRLGT
jgi:hypothetical protein